MERAGFYYKHEHQWQNVEDFQEVMLRCADLHFFQPSPLLAPWHWQTIAGGVTVNFWPHVAKWHVEGEKVRQGWRGCVERLRTIADSQPDTLVEDI
jgi:hypothetical protein